MINLLTETLVRFDKSWDGRAEASLTEVYGALAADSLDAFPALRPHQRHAWRSFLGQLGATAMHRADPSNPPHDSDERRRIIRALTESELPDDEPWRLAVDDITKPAFMQPPCPLLGAVLTLMPDEPRLRHARRPIARSSSPALLALERDAVLARADAPAWRPPSVNAVLDLRSVLARIRPGGAFPPEPAAVTSDAPRRLRSRRRSRPASHFETLGETHTRPALRLALDIAEGHGEPAGRLRAASPLEGFGLVTRAPARKGRLALTDRGLAMLARRDRASMGVARKLWSVAPMDPEGSTEWNNVSGGRSRQPLRKVERTAAVHAFAAALPRPSRSLGWELTQPASGAWRDGGRLSPCECPTGPPGRARRPETGPPGPSGAMNNEQRTGTAHAPFPARRPKSHEFPPRR